MNPAFWRGKRVFLTGHTGFKGGWLALWLAKLGAKVAGYSRPPATKPNFFDAVNIGDHVGGGFGELADARELSERLRAHRSEIVIHMAAQALVLPSYEDPIETFATNVMGTVNVLDAVRKTDCVRAVINVTSDKCYQNKETVRGYREDDQIGGHDPYSASKGAAELVTAAYRSSFFDATNDVRLASVRAGNVIGGGDWSPHRLVPDIVRAFANGENVRLRHPNAVRAWQHVLDPLHGYLILAERLFENDGEGYACAWNFGPDAGEIHPVEQVTAKIAALWGNRAAYTIDNTASEHEAGLLLLDSTRANDKLAWKPKLSLDDSLAWLTDWYRAFYSGKRDLRALTVAQIDRFEKM